MKQLITFTGKDLIDLGFRKGAWFREAIDFVNENELEGKNLLTYLEQFRLPDPIDLHANFASFHQNIKAENELTNGLKIFLLLSKKDYKYE